MLDKRFLGSTLTIVLGLLHFMGFVGAVGSGRGGCCRCKIFEASCAFIEPENLHGDRR